ncbi:hypothetical protein YEP4_15602 [Yersinia enterocolitica subsp. palearctica YE-P4]|nr:hypothetical protein CH48_1403 [Yersinia enterocolitica]EHB21547.1 hypothetical protein IOK_07009 [Yersinia enterocolitica subsp. palearctica PhRBD_Ye1]EOR66700.1 hypothetical protein YE149_15709 [Yersinia enterocolitica subsp. palearctica YE-149]EOR74311.1 hypothetical protein YE150_15640 [Yersinia enterocolitica subsp. palearctica YE-150]EOR74964.1 hypothetical protein YEP1_15699 [Yersinia enterocolitica subsp. palearctica YE-P1]EOR78086.1 hypothetical protein YEP4_15602 [Yersinia enteroc
MRALSLERRLTINQKQNGMLLPKMTAREQGNKQDVIPVAEFRHCLRLGGWFSLAN